jgi:hydrogenase maturation protein HypF
VQAAAGFLAQVEGLPDSMGAPFFFPERYRNAGVLVRKGVRTFTTTSMGRLFDAAAALLGFTREVSFEGQAAIWLEQLARRAPVAFVDAYAFPFADAELDFRPLLRSVASDRVMGRDVAEIARAFQRGVAGGLCEAVAAVALEASADTVVLSGGVFQNGLLLEDTREMLGTGQFHIWTNHAVPANDGGISLGQAALAAFGRFDSLR